MMKYSGLIMMVIITSCAYDQTEICPCYKEDQPPVYLGCGPVMEGVQCTSEMITQVLEAVKYPAAAREDSISGRVVIAFDIFKNGTMGNYTAINDTLGYGLAEAAIAAIKTLEEFGFCPARENCEPVVYNYKFPVKFVLK